MKNIKRVLAVVLALTMALGTIASVSATALSAKWYADAVDFVESAGIADSIGSKADDKITRAEFALWIAKVEAGQYYVESEIWKNDGLANIIIFDDVDVSVDGIYRAAINYCYQRNFIKGDGNNKFNPGKVITLAEASAIIVRLMGYELKVHGDEKDWEYNYWNVANNYCKAFDATWSTELKMVDPTYELTYGDAAYLIYTILNKGETPTDIEEILKLRCLTYEGENLGEKFPNVSLTQVAIVTGLDLHTVYYNYNAWKYAIPEYKCVKGTAGTFTTYSFVYTDGTNEYKYDSTNSVKSLTYEIDGDVKTFYAEDGTPVDASTVDVIRQWPAEWPATPLDEFQFGAETTKKFVSYTTNVVEPTSTPKLVTLNIDGSVKEVKEIALYDLEKYVRIANDKVGTVEFNLGDYIANGSVVKAKFDKEGTLTSMKVASTEKASRLVSDTFVVAAGTGATDKITYDENGNITKYGHYPYLANANTGADYTPVLPTSYTADKVISFEGSGSDVKVTVAGKTYDIVQSRAVDTNEIVFYDVTETLVPLTDAKVVARTPNTAEGEHCVEFTDLDGDGYYDIAVIQQYATFQYRDWTNGDPRDVETDKIGPVGGVVIDKVVSIATGNYSTDGWALEDEKASGKIQLVVAASCARFPGSAEAEKYYGNIYSLYTLPAYKVIDIADVNSGYIQSVEKETKTIGGKAYYVATIVDVKTGDKVKAYVPTTASSVASYTTISVEIAGASTLLDVYSGDWMPFLDLEAEYRADGIDKIGSVHTTGAWMVGRTVRYARTGDVSATVTGDATDILCYMAESAQKVSQGFVVSVDKTNKGDNTFKVTVAESGTSASADWCTELDTYFTYQRGGINGAVNVYGKNYFSWAHHDYNEGDGLNGFEALIDAVAALTSAADMGTTTLADIDATLKTAILKGLESTDATITLTAAATTYGVPAAQVADFYAACVAGTATPAFAGLYTGREALTAMGVTDIDRWVAYVLGMKAAGIAANKTSNAWAAINTALIAVNTADGSIDSGVFTMDLTTFDATYSTTLATGYADCATIADIAAKYVPGLDLATLAAKIVAGDIVTNSTCATKLKGITEANALIIRSGYYTTSKFAWNKGTCKAPDKGWFTALSTIVVATGAKSYDVRANASSIWDYDNYAVYHKLFGEQSVVMEHTASTEKLGGYDLIYVDVIKDGAKEYVLLYKDETTSVYADDYQSKWLNHYTATGTMYTKDNNATFGDVWSDKGEFAYKSESHTAETYSWKQYSSEVILSGVDENALIASARTADGTSPVTHVVEATVKVGKNPYYKKSYDGSAIVGYTRYFESVGTYKVNVTLTPVALEPIIRYIPVVEADGTQTKAETAADVAMWESITADIDGNPVTYKVLDGLVYKKTQLFAGWKTEGGKVVYTVKYDLATKVLSGVVSNDVVISDADVSKMNFVKITATPDGLFEYAVEFDGRTYECDGDVQVIVMQPDLTTGELKGTVYDIETLVSKTGKVFATTSQVAATGTNLNCLTLIGEVKFPGGTTPPVTPPVDDSTVVVKLDKAGVTIEALELGNNFVVRSTYSATVKATGADFGSICRVYSTYVDAVKAASVNFANITAGEYTVYVDTGIIK